MSHNIEIEEGAFLVSDAHFSDRRPQLYAFIEAIYFEKLLPTQLIFMGDIFDTLFGGIEYTYLTNQKLINMINEISLEIEVVYLEGNHDFNLKDIFTNVKIFKISEQPVQARYKDKYIYLSHGDFDGNFGYKLYSLLIRNPIVLKVLKLIDNISNHSILNYIDNHLGEKDDCKEFADFEEFVNIRIAQNYNFDYFIEGHFHQNKMIKFKNSIYINLAAFACNQRYFIVKSLQDKELLEENIFSKGM